MMQLLSIYKKIINSIRYILYLEEMIRGEKEYEI